MFVSVWMTPSLTSARTALRSCLVAANRSILIDPVFASSTSRVFCLDIAIVFY